MLDLCFDLETQDPDDVLTLCLVARHPRVRLRAVTVAPGSPGQVGLVRHVLRLLEREDVPVGARDPGTGKDHVSGFHRRWLGGWRASEPDGDVPEVLLSVLARHPETTLLTGGPLRNLRLLLECGRPVRLARWVAQGGFAGDPVVPPERRLAKFDGLTACPTFNFNGEPTAALMALAPEAPIIRRELVSKNVTHGVRYDRAFHERLEPHRDATPGLALIWQGMDLYLRRRPGGKLLHDPTAACAAIEPSVAEWAEAEITREPGGWAARPRSGTRTFITTGLDQDALFAVLAEGPGRNPSKAR